MRWLGYPGLLCLSVSWAQDPTAILRDSCAPCHSNRTRSSGFSIDQIHEPGARHGRAVVPGHPEKSPLVRFIKGELNPRMPLGGKALSAAEIQSIEEWIRSMPASASPLQTEHRWPFEKPRISDPALAASGGMDAFIQAKLKTAGLKPAPPADARTLVRRVYFDLVGVPPTPHELAEYLANPDYPKLIDKLLADPRYGERWGRHWLDLARYGETSGLEGDGAIGNAWRYRDWVIDAFNNNMPYDKFVIAQLAGGDEHSKSRNNYQPDAQGYISTGFLRVAPWDRSNLVAAEVRQNYLSEVTSVTGSVFLGLTVGCARCHDHKYDPIPQRDYYRLQAFFNTTQPEGTPNVPFQDKAFAAKAKAKVKEIEERIEKGPEKQALEELEKALLPKLIAARKQRAAAAHGFTKPDLRLELRLAKQRVFTEAEKDHYLELRAAAERTGDPEEQAPLDALEDRMLARLKEAYRTTADPAMRFDALDKDDVRREAMAEYSGKSIFSQEEKARYGDLNARIEVLRNRAGRWKPSTLGVMPVPGPPSGPEPGPTRILKRGDYLQPGEPVEPGFPRVLTPGGKEAAAVIETDRYRQYPTRGWRLTLAKWIASKDNPLTARVMVNRIWRQHFGEGIVRTTSDFGRNGDRPSHPELLDYLAVRFMDSGWNVKAMHREILLSNTYRQASENPASPIEKTDPDNRLLSRFNRRRLEAEALRDSILHVSGRLNPERGGPSVFPPLPADLADFARYGRSGGVMWESNESEADERRRSVYVFQRRSLPLPMMASFDAIVFSESCERRTNTTTPLQALSMMNGDLVREESVQMAKRVEGGSRQQQITRAFEYALQRAPKPSEMEMFLQFPGTLASICKVLLESNEFLYVD
jgi:hypothetical protein